MSVKRFDVGSFRKPKKTAQGFLKADAYATRVGIFKYKTFDGKEIKEFRSPEEVFKADSLQSLAEILVTNDHPPEFITTENSKKYSAGFTSEKVDRDGLYAKISTTITDAELIKDIESGKIQTSCGYRCDVEFVAGEYKGEKYDAIQKNIVYNHLAVVTKGRAGSDVRLRMDSDDAEMMEELPAPESGNSITNGRGMKVKQMAKFKIDSVEFETEDTGLAQAIVKKCDELDTSKKDKETLQGKLDASVDEIKTLKSDLEKAKAEKLDHEAIMKIARARLDLETHAKKFLGEETKLDSMTEVEIKKEVIKKQKPELSLESKTDAYVDGCFDIVIQSQEVKTDKADEIISGKVQSGSEKIDSESARNKMIERSRDLWTKPVGKHLAQNS